MRRVVMVALIVVLTTPSEASKSCMTKTEARQHFSSAHIYWHGADHCWDATRKRRHHRIDKEQEEDLVHNVQKKVAEPKWHQAMSEMLPDEAPSQKSWSDRWIDIEPSQLALAERWVDIVQLAPPQTFERKSEPLVTRGVMVAIVFATLVLATLILLGGMIYDRRSARPARARIR